MGKEEGFVFTLRARSPTAKEKATVLKVKAFGGEQGAKGHDPASWR
jgi:hypothetical protein